MRGATIHKPGDLPITTTTRSIASVVCNVALTHTPRPARRGSGSFVISGLGDPKRGDDTLTEAGPLQVSKFPVILKARSYKEVTP